MPSSQPSFSASLCTAIGLAVVLCAGAAGVAQASPSAEGSFVESAGSKSIPDVFSVTNAPSGGSAIAELLFDLGGSAGAAFDPGDAPFGVTGGDDVGFDVVVGFDLIAPGRLRLVFDDFDPGETFAFGVDVDDAKGQTTGDDFAGATLSVTFAAGSAPRVGVFAADPLDDYRATVLIHNPEPATALLVALGVIALSLGRRRR